MKISKDVISLHESNHWCFVAALRKSRLSASALFDGSQAAVATSPGTCEGQGYPGLSPNKVPIDGYHFVHAIGIQYLFIMKNKMYIYIY